MIRLNDINKTVIDEKEVQSYIMCADNYYSERIGTNIKKESIGLSFRVGGAVIRYDTKELRDKDIELLDKLFGVKDIEEKVENMCMLKENKKLLANGEYLTWDYVVKSGEPIQAEMPNGDIRTFNYNSDFRKISISAYGNNFVGSIYDEDLFNSLMLKKVE